jgi:endonuclease YncB( thermonuclease family)
LGFGIFVREKLRLRGINTPEISTPAGQKAKKYVESLLPAGSPLILKSHQTDNYGRFVADVFFGPAAPARRSVSAPKSLTLSADGLTYLNQKLLDESHAVRMEE